MKKSNDTLKITSEMDQDHFYIIFRILRAHHLAFPNKKLKIYI